MCLLHKYYSRWMEEEKDTLEGACLNSAGHVSRFYLITLLINHYIKIMEKFLKKKIFDQKIESLMIV